MNFIQQIQKNTFFQQSSIYPISQTLSAPLSLSYPASVNMLSDYYSDPNEGEDRYTFFFQNGEVGNRVIRFQKNLEAEEMVFVPNWRANIQQWTPFIETLSQNHSVEYFESREKAGTQYKTDDISFDIETLATDLVNYLNQKTEDYHLIGASLGATTIIKAWKKLRRKPKSLTLICPFLQLKLPTYLQLLPLLGPGIVSKTAPLAYRLLKNTNQLQSLSKVLRKDLENGSTQKLLRLKASVESLIDINLDINEIKEIDCPSFILYALNDKKHIAAEAEAIQQAIAGAQSLAFEDFNKVQEEEGALAIETWMN